LRNDKILNNLKIDTLKAIEKSDIENKTGNTNNDRATSLDRYNYKINTKNNKILPNIRKNTIGIFID